MHAARLLRGGSAATAMSPAREPMLAAVDSAEQLHRADTLPAAVNAAASRAAFSNNHEDAGAAVRLCYMSCPISLPCAVSLSFSRWQQTQGSTI